MTSWTEFNANKQSEEEKCLSGLKCLNEVLLVALSNKI